MRPFLRAVTAAAALLAALCLASPAHAVPPVAFPQNLDVRFETPKSITLDAETGAVSVTYAIATLPTHGSVDLLGRYATYTPAAGFVGSDSFTFTATTVNGTSEPATISLNVLALVPPTVPDASANIPFNTRWDIVLLFSDINPGGPFQYSFALVTPPTHGSVYMHGAFASYTPALGYSGADSFTFTVATENGTSNVGTANLTVLPGVLPLAHVDSAATPYETPLPVALAASDANPGGPFAFTYAIDMPPQHGAIADFDASTGTLVYTPDSGYYGADELRFTATTVNGTSAPAAVSLTVIPPPSHLALSDDGSPAYARYGQMLDYALTLSNDGGQAASTVAVAFTLSEGFDGDYARIACFGDGAGARCEPDVADPWRYSVALPPGRSLTWFVSAPVRHDTQAPDVELAMSATGASSASIARASTLVLHRDGFDAIDDTPLAFVDGAAAKALFDGDALREMVVPPLSENVTATLLRVRDGARELRVEGREVAGSVLVRLRETDVRGQESASAWSTSRVGDMLTLGSEAASDPAHEVAAAAPRTFVLTGAQPSIAL